MRKLLSVLLCVMLIFVLLPAEGIKANATDEYISLNKEYTITVAEEKNTVLKFTPSKTGYYSFTSNSDSDLFCTVYKGEEEISFNDDGGGLRDFSVKAKLQAGVTYTYEISVFYGYCNNATVKVEEAVYVTDIKVEKSPYNITYLKGYVDDYFSDEGLELYLTFSDGSKYLWCCSEEYVWDMFDMTIDTSAADTTGNAVIVIDDAACKLPLNILNKTIKSIEVIDNNFAPLEEGVQGMYTYDDDYNEFFCYYSDYHNLGLKVKYSDGSSDTLASIDDPLFNVYYAYSEDNQFENKWSVNGTKNTLTIELLNAKAEYNVKIVSNPVKSITINTAPTREYFYGDLEYGEYFYGEYFFYPDDLTGLKFTVNFKNGTKKSYTYNDIDETDFTINGYALEIDCDFFAEAGQIPVTIMYRGCEATYNVTLKESNVSKIEIIKAPTVTQLENDSFLADYIGTQFKITYKNKKTKTVTVTESNSRYVYSPEFGEVGVEVSVDGYIAKFYTEYDAEYGCTTILSYLDVSCNKDNLIIMKENEFKNIEVIEFNSNGKIVVKITFENNLSETLTINPKTYIREDYGDLVEATVLATTKFGAVHYQYYMYEKNIGVFELELFGKYYEFKITAPKGDFDFSGKVDLQDLVMQAQYVAGWDITCDDSAMNVNGDQNTDLLDVVYLAQYVAGWQNIVLK